LRVEINENHELSLQLTAGAAEIFGTALTVGQPVKLRGGSTVAVFTWDGCMLDLFSNEFPVDLCASLIYESSETPMQQYLNAHHALNKERSAALKASQGGPRVMVVGPTDSGKSTLCSILVNYAVRSASHPVLVDLDLGQGSLTPPGCITATPCEAPLDLQDGSAVEVPLVYFLGDITVAGDGAHYRGTVETMAAQLDLRASGDPEANGAGVIINSMGWIDGLGYDLMLHSIRAFKVDRVIVLGDDRLFNQLDIHFRQQRLTHVKVSKLSKSGGVVTRQRKVRVAARADRTRRYFYGPDNSLEPVVVRLRYSEVSVFKVAPGVRAPSTALPIGATSGADPLRVSPVTPGPELLHSLLAISHAIEPSQIIRENVAGFLYVKDVDREQQMLVCLAPCAGSLPGTLLLASSFKIQEFE